MRQIGTLSNQDEAQTFEDYLLSQGMKANVEQSDGAWAVWIYDEDDVEPAREELAAFRENPEASQFTEGARTAADVRREEEKQRRDARKKQVDMRERWRRPMSARSPVTAALIFISVAVAIVGTNWNTALEGGLFGMRLCNRETTGIVPYLFIQSFERAGNDIRFDPNFADVLSGQIWRLVTPIFLHFGPLHLLFNMLWLRDLGGAIELRRGHLRMLMLVLAIAVLSNSAQYVWDGPNFGGMSGVVFGLFGYIWIKGRYEPEAGLHMPPNLVFLMIAWFVICMTGAVGPIANTAHGVGLLVGIVAGYWPTFVRKIQGR